MNVYAQALEKHKEWRGKVEIISKATVKNSADLSLAYSPGVAAPCREIAENPERVWDYTWKGNTIAVVSDGTAVLGLGNIGPAAALPVMEGKAVLFKEFANVNAIPLCLNTQDVDEIVQIVKSLEPTIAGVNLEDISAPRCFCLLYTSRQSGAHSAAGSRGLAAHALVSDASLFNHPCGRLLPVHAGHAHCLDPGGVQDSPQAQTPGFTQGAGGPVYPALFHRPCAEMCIRDRSGSTPFPCCCCLPPALPSRCGWPNAAVCSARRRSQIVGRREEPHLTVEKSGGEASNFLVGWDR